jgi:signal transduction histidine kinase
LANVSHEIRTPMNGICGAVDLLNETKLTLSQQELVQMMHKCSKSLLNLINEILDISKMESMQMKIELSTFSLENLVAEAQQLFSEVSKKKNIELLYRISCIDLTITTDPQRLRQVLINLLGNALKFTEKGFVLLEVTSSLLVHGKSTLKFSVKDTGIGNF